VRLDVRRQGEVRLVAARERDRLAAREPAVQPVAHGQAAFDRLVDQPGPLAIGDAQECPVPPRLGFTDNDVVALLRGLDGHTHAVGIRVIDRGQAEPRPQRRIRGAAIDPFGVPAAVVAFAVAIGLFVGVSVTTRPPADSGRAFMEDIRPALDRMRVW